MNRPYIVFLRRENAQISQIGEKALSINSLAKYGIKIQNGFVITTTAFSEFMEENHLTNSINKLTMLCEGGETDNSVVEHLRNAIFNCPIPQSIVKSIKNALIDLNISNLIIRSSAPQEDGAETSFAGMHETILNVPSLIEKCIFAVRKCWASTFSERAVFYRKMKKNNIDWNIAVLIQEMAFTSCAGTTWTHFLKENQLLIESVPGLGANLASGLATADSFLIDMTTMNIISAHIPVKTMKSICNPYEGIKDCEIFLGSSTLSIKTIRKITDISIRISNLKGIPQLIEWGVLNDEVIIFQSRPATSDYQVVSKPTSLNTSINEYEHTFSGIVASPGFAQGISRSFVDIENLNSIVPGEIVIGKHLTPEMVVFLENAIAIVTETGGLTSHAAVIARELNIPALVSVSNATQNIPTGSKVAVDGEKGFVGLVSNRKTTIDKRSIDEEKTPLNNSIIESEQNSKFEVSTSFIDVLGDINKLIKTERLVLSNTGSLVASSLEFDVIWKSTLTKNDINSIKKNWLNDTGLLLISTADFIKNPKHSTFNDLCGRFINFYVYNLIAEAYPIEQFLRVILDNYVKPSLNHKLLAEIIDISCEKKISFTQLLTCLLLPLPDTYISLIRIADNHDSVVKKLRSTFDQLLQAYETNNNEFICLGDDLIKGVFPARITESPSFSVYAIEAYNRIMDTEKFLNFSYILRLANLFTVINDVNRFLPLAYAHELDLALSEIFPNHVRKGDWPWNQLMQIYQTLSQKEKGTQKLMM